MAAAIKLFAKKGYNATSVQEIADECNISKGAFYIYFKSKEALMFSMLQYYYDKMFSRISHIQTENVDPKTVYRKQLTVFYEDIFEYKDFIIMQLKENSFPYNEEVELLIRKIKKTILEFHIKNILNIYGKKVEQYLADLCFMIEGISQTFIEIVILFDHPIKSEQLADTILQRIDDLAYGMTKRKETPLISIEKANIWFGPFEQIQLDPLSEAILTDIHQKVNSLSLDDKTDVIDTLHILEAELKKGKPRLAIIKGMILNLKEISCLREDAEKLTYLLKYDDI